MRSTTLAILAAGAVSAQETVSFFLPYGGAEASDLAQIAASVVTVEGSHTVLAMSCVDTATATPDATITKGSSLAARATSSASSDDSDDSSDDAVEGISDYTDSLSDDTSDEDLEDLGDFESSGCYLAAPLTMTVGSDYLKYSTVIDLGGAMSIDYTMAMECTRSDSSNGICVQSVGGADAWADACQMTAGGANLGSEALDSCISANAGKTIPPTTTTLSADDMGSIAIPVTAGADKLSASASASATGSASAKATGSAASATASKTGSSKSSAASATGSAPAANGAASVRGGAAFAAAVMGAVVAVLAF